jgi:hypothetical protein
MPQGDWDRMKKFSEQVLKVYGGEDRVLEEKPISSIKIFSTREFETMTGTENNAAISSYTVVIKSDSGSSIPGPSRQNQVDEILRKLDDLDLHTEEENREVFGKVLHLYTELDLIFSTDTLLRPRYQDHLGCGPACHRKHVHSEPVNSFRTMSLLDMYESEGKYARVLNCLEIPILGYEAPYGLE